MGAVAEQYKYDLARRHIREEKWKVLAGSGVILGTKGKPLGTVNNHGYVMVAIKRQGKVISMPAHRVIYEYVRGPLAPELQVDHIDGKKTNNKYMNLFACPGAENNRRANATGLMPRKVQPKRVLAIRRLHQAGLDLQEIADLYGVSKRLVRDIVLRQTWDYVE
jgi:hypothetical protein